MERKCVVCGTAFRRKGSARLTCSQKCQREQTKITQRKSYFRRKLKKIEDETELRRILKMLSSGSGYVCANCGEIFEKSSCLKTSYKYCSNVCQREYSKEARLRRKKRKEQTIINEYKENLSPISKKILELEQELELLRERQQPKKAIPEYYLNRGDILSNLSTGETFLG